jgi:ligand-binding SRPBCC domain-containing protein
MREASQRTRRRRRRALAGLSTARSHPTSPGVKTYVLEREQVLPQDLDHLFAFFADAHNLERLTPPFLHFRILTPGPIEMRAGALIDYRIKLRGIPVRWRTEIAAWEPPFRFVDQQLRGPYRKWVHEHRFEAVPGGVRCLDRVEYVVPGGPLFEGMAHSLFVRGELERIFDYRAEVMRELFGTPRAKAAADERIAAPAP